MKKMFFLSITLIVLITALFLLFTSDCENINRSFLQGYGIKTEKNALYSETLVIPEEFDSFFNSYNAIQIEAGLDLTPYKGRRAVRYTYRILNFPEGTPLANVICIGTRPVAGDISEPALDGFMLPLSYMLWQAH